MSSNLSKGTLLNSSKKLLDHRPLFFLHPLQRQCDVKKTRFLTTLKVLNGSNDLNDLHATYRRNKKRHDQSIRSFLVHFGFCLCLPIQLSHVIALFLVHFVIKYLFFVVRWSQTILRLSKKKNGKIKKTLCEGIMNMFCSIDFG